MSNIYRRSTDFTVVVKDLCEVCKTLQAEVQKRSRYVYGYGYVDQTGCQACFDAAVKEAELEAKENTKAYPYGSFF